jgi:hypothetical protein
MSYQSVQLDPLNSPHPVPWSWVLATLNDAGADHQPRHHYYRSQSLISPDGQFAAYSRIQLQAQPQFFQSRITSILFLENLKTGDLQAITPTSPFSGSSLAEDRGEEWGEISIVIPISWSATSDRLLAREFEALFCSDIASDYAVIVDRPCQRVSTIAPTRMSYTNAVLLGWSYLYPERALFRAGELGQANWDEWTVDAAGETTLAENDRPITFGRVFSNVWMGPQSHG